MTSEGVMHVVEYLERDLSSRQQEFRASKETIDGPWCLSYETAPTIDKAAR